MKQADISCTVCNIILVTVVKEDVTQDDIDLYKLQTDCNLQHQSIDVTVQDV